MAVLVQTLPCDLTVMAPFVLLPDLIAHEEQLLARMRPHESEIGAQIGKLLPRIARSAAVEGTFAVHDLVMGKRQDEFLGKRVEQTEGQILMVPVAMRRVAAEIAQRVVHPTHV